MKLVQSIVGVFFSVLLCACGGGEGVDATGRLNAVVEHGLVSSVVGTGTGKFDGDGKYASLNNPSAVAVGIDGAIYIADTANHRIRKSVNGVVTTLAGTGLTTPFADGPGALATFSSPQGIAVDASGNVYVADTGNHRIRKITLAGDVDTLAGNGFPGALDNSAPKAARFNEPRGIAVDSSGSTVYVSDNATHIIRKITDAEGVVTLAGVAGGLGAADGVGIDARFNKPWGLALSASGYLYVADRGDYYGANNLIRKIEVSSGAVSTFAGRTLVMGKEDGAALNATFSGPAGVAVYFTGGADTVYVADTDNNLIRKIDSAGVVSTFAGSGSRGDTDAVGTFASFNSPQGVAVDKNGDIYVADTSSHLIRKIKK